VAHKVVDRILEQVDLVEHAARPAVALSGGQKRKLSVGIALVGNPKILFLEYGRAWARWRMARSPSATDVVGSR